ncbi:MAG: hypothetical protein AAFU73_23230 [Planctomycetota bacterium]
MKLILLAPALLLGSAATAAAQVPSIYVDLTDTNFGTTGTPPPTFGGAANLPGMWNEVDTAGVIGTTFNSGPLMDANGNPTMVELALDGGANNIASVDFDNALMSGDDAALLEDCIFFDGAGTITFSNLPAGNYDVYTYAIAPDDDTYETFVDVAASASGSQIVGGDFAAGYVLGTTHALHTVSVGAPGTIVISVDVATEFDSINGFQLIPAGGGGPGVLGSPFCAANPNSTGVPGEIHALGSALVANNDVELRVSSVPAGQFGIFVVSRTFGTPVPVGDGNLCLNGQIGRYQDLSQIWQADPMGEAGLVIDLQTIPQPMSIETVMPGETWSWQAWHRDVNPMGPTSNFTNGVSIPFI